MESSFLWHFRQNLAELLAQYFKCYMAVSDLFRENRLIIH